MKFLDAAVLEKKNKINIIRGIKIPKIKNSQILIKVMFSGVCGSQIFEISCQRNNSKYLPHMLGHEATGKVIDIGRDIKKVKIGDSVILSWIKSSGKDSKLPEYFYPNSKKKINAGKLVTFNNYCIVSEQNVNKVSKKENLEKLTFLGCSFATGAGMIINQSTINSTSKVLIIGLGGIGISSFLVANQKKPSLLVGLEVNQKRLKNLKKNINTNKKVILLNPKSAKYNKFLKINKFDLVIESSGVAKNIELGIKFLKDSGKLVFATHPKKSSYIKFDPYELIKGKQIVGSWGGSVNFDNQLKNLMYIKKKIKNFDKIFLSKAYSLSNISKAIKDFKSKKILRPIIKMEHD